MVSDPSDVLRRLVEHSGRYAEQAFLFVREGLSFAAEQTHGPETEAHQRLQEYLAAQNMDWHDLLAKYHTSELPPEVIEAIDMAGGCERLNRHVSGRELCWGLRDYAVGRWGMLARTVLDSWNITKTSDFGRIVFGFIELDMMQKQEGDCLADFEDVYSFDEAFDNTIQITSQGRRKNGKDT
ncbi:MAG: hypothetical protein JSU63_16575 [Phycisphaerales bacterium]|nr:MAG: hypothetical protein JSU63_16575 [Phycisphaerales bacterium]